MEKTANQILQQRCQFIFAIDLLIGIGKQLQDKILCSKTQKNNYKSFPSLQSHPFLSLIPFHTPPQSILSSFTSFPAPLFCCCLSIAILFISCLFFDVFNGILDNLSALVLYCLSTYSNFQQLNFPIIFSTQLYKSTMLTFETRALPFTASTTSLESPNNLTLLMPFTYAFTSKNSSAENYAWLLVLLPKAQHASNTKSQPCVMQYPTLAGPGLNFEQPSKQPVITLCQEMGRRSGVGVNGWRMVCMCGVRVRSGWVRASRCQRGWGFRMPDYYYFGGVKVGVKGGVVMGCCELLLLLLLLPFG